MHREHSAYTNLTCTLRAPFVSHTFHFRPMHGQVSRAIAAEKTKNKEKDAQQTKLNREIVFSDLRNPQKKLTPLFGEVVKLRKHTERQEQASCNDEEFERCVPQTT